MDLEPRHHPFVRGHTDRRPVSPREHLHDLAKFLEFMLGGGKDAWLAARLAELDAGNIEAIRAFPLADKKARDLQTALGYFECFSLSLTRQYDKLAR